MYMECLKKSLWKYVKINYKLLVTNDPYDEIHHIPNPILNFSWTNAKKLGDLG